MRVTIATLLALLATPAFAELALPVMAGELPIAEERLGVAPHERSGPIVAASRDQYLVVWNDQRIPSTPRVRAARVSADGEVLDPAGIPIESSSFDWSTGVRAVASDGTDFLVLHYAKSALHLTRVTAAGTVVPVPDPGLSGPATLIWSGDAYVLFAAEGHSGESIRAAVLDREARVVVPARDVIISTSGINTVAAAAGSHGQGVLLAWTQSYDGRVYSRLLPSAGLRLGNLQPFAALPREGFAEQAFVRSAASDGDSYLVSWSLAGAVPRSRVRQIDGTGTVTGSVVDLSVAAPAPLWWTGSHYVAPAATGRALVHLAADGSQQDVEQLAPGTPMSLATIGTLAGKTLVVWHAARDARTYGSSLFIELAGAPNATRNLLSRGLPYRSDVSVVWRGDHYLAVWLETRDTRRLMRGRLSADGRPLDGPGIPLSSDLPLGLSAPSMASDGDRAVIAWSEGLRLRVAIVDRSGRIAYDDVAGVSSHGSPPVVHWNGTQYLIVYPSPGNAWSAIRLRRDGTRSDEQPAAISNRSTPAMAIGWTGQEYVAFWIEYGFCFPICTPPASLWSLSLSPDLQPIGAPLQLAAPQVTGRPEIGESSDGLLVVWAHGAQQSRLRGIRINRVGMLLDPLNGFDIGVADRVSTVDRTEDGWNVVSGANAWNVSLQGMVGPMTTPFAFLPKVATLAIVNGGPLPLMVYRRDIVGLDLDSAVRARFIPPARQRAVRR